MKKSFKRWLLIGVYIMLFGSMITYGAEIKEKPLLTIESAIQSAYGRSSALSLNVQQYKVLQEKLRANQNKGGSYVSYQQLYIQKNETERENQYIKDRIAHDVTIRYQTVINGEKELKYLEKEIDVQTKALGQLKLQKEKGLVSKLQYESAELELRNLKTTLKTKTETLKSEKSSFKNLTGKNVDDYILDDTIVYEPFRIEGSIEGYCDRIATDYFKYNKELAELGMDYIIIDGMPGPEYSDYLNSKYNAEKALQGVEDGTKSMKQNLMASYSNLLNLEEQIGTLQYQVEFMKQQLKVVEVNYRLGMKTQLEYEKQALSLDKLEQNLRNLMTNYNKLQNVLTKPWVSMGAGL